MYYSTFTTLIVYRENPYCVFLDVAIPSSKENSFFHMNVLGLKNTKFEMFGFSLTSSISAKAVKVLW